MRILAIDTATEICSVALLIDGACSSREVLTQRTHAELVLPMVDELLREASLTLREVDCIAYGRGPGAFTGVRVAVGVVQGLAFGARRPTVGVSSLAAVAYQVMQPDALVLVCMDARMSEVYTAIYSAQSDGGLELESPERVLAPGEVDGPIAGGRNRAMVLAGTGFRAYPELRARFPDLPVHDELLPHARDIAALAQIEFKAGRAQSAANVQPTYLRDKVTFVNHS
jgi:tRNA threonylcarbamoyladenosine biosynthesis protein TsaB